MVLQMSTVFVVAAALGGTHYDQILPILYTIERKREPMPLHFAHAKDTDENIELPYKYLISLECNAPTTTIRFTDTLSPRASTGES